MWLAGFGWVVIFLITLYCLFATFGIFFGSLGLTGKVAGEFWFIAAFAAFFVWLSYYTWPFHVTLSLVAS
uniref:Uncharacterized protein n=1 Tax=Pseudomonas phage Nican01 TaxID=3138540 RepID=A0AAU6W0G3_9CAUD